MLYIIDANNLAGKLEILGEDGFDLKLIGLIKGYSQKKKIILVFDGIDLMGDKYRDGNLTIVRTPKDNFYKNADDKILELTKYYLETGKEEITIITDDREIWDKIKNFKNKKIFIYPASKFILKLKPEEKSEQNEKEDLSKEEQDKINEELLKIWNK